MAGAIKKEGMNRADLYKYFAFLGFKVGAEIGVLLGRNAEVIFDNIPGVKLYLIDPYKNYRYVQKPRTESKLIDARKIAYRRLKHKNRVFIEMLSEDAVKKFEDDSLDFGHIDGEHSYDMAMLDIILWSRKVRVGGIISGHDYIDSRGYGVKLAANDYVTAHGLTLYITDETAEDVEKIASWFWIKK